MFCPSCGTGIDKPGKFCASCGTPLPNVTPAAEQAVAAVPPPPAKKAAAQAKAAPAEAAALEAVAAEAAQAAADQAAPVWAQTPPPPPAWSPATPPQQSPAQPPAVQPGPFAVPQPGAFGTPARRAGSASSGAMGGILALIGGGLAIGSAWLPWMITGDDLFSQDNWWKPIDLPMPSDVSKLADTLTETGGLANYHYLFAAAGLAAVCGLLLLFVRSDLRRLLALGAIAGAIGIGLVEYSAFGPISQTIDAANAFGSSVKVTMGFGLYVGAIGAVVAAIGGLRALLAR
jgi:hypothetical protein